MAQIQSPGGPDRLMSALEDYAAQEAKHFGRHPFFLRGGKEETELKLNFYKNILASNKKVKGLSQAEKSTILFIRSEIIQLKAKQSPSVLWNLFARFENWVGQYTSDKYIYQNLKNIEKHNIVEPNLEYLQNALKSKGFVQNIDADLLKFMSHNSKEFSLRYFDNKTEVSYLLHFVKPPGSEAYTFEGYKASKHNSLESLDSKKNPDSSMFVKMNEKNAPNVQEVAHILEGRPVKREIDGKSHWYGMNQEKTAVVKLGEFQNSSMKDMLSKIPVKDASQYTYQKLIDTIAAGGRPEITLSGPGGDRKYKVGLSPDSKELQLFSKNGVRPDITFSNTNNRPIDAEKLKQILLAAESGKVIQMGRSPSRG